MGRPRCEPAETRLEPQTPHRRRPIELAKNPKLTFEQYQELEQARGIYTRTEMIANGAFGLTGAVDDRTTKDLSELADVRSFLAGLASYRGALARDERIPTVLGLITQEKERLQREVASREFKTLKSSNSPVDLRALLDSIDNSDAIVEIVGCSPARSGHRDGRSAGR